MRSLTSIQSHLGSLGGRMKFQRRLRNLTQEQLGTLAGTSQAVIQKIENGKSLRPRKIDEIAAVLEVHPAWLMFGEDEGAALDRDARRLAAQWMKLSPGDRKAVQDEVERLAAKASATPAID